VNIDLVVLAWSVKSEEVIDSYGIIVDKTNYQFASEINDLFSA
jgi:hypothetical protein